MRSSRLNSANHAFQRGTGRRVEFFRHASGAIRLAAGYDRVLHGFCHQHRILGSGNPCVHEDGVSTQFHGDCGVRGSAHARVNDDWKAGDKFAQNADAGLILDFHAAADGSAERHDGGRASIYQAFCEDDIVRRVGKDREALLHQDASCLKRGLNVGIERGLVADDLEFDPV